MGGTTRGLVWFQTLTIASHQNSATSPILMEVNSTSHTSILNILPTKISVGRLFLRLSSITVLSKLSNRVWKWNTSFVGRKAEEKKENKNRIKKEQRYFSCLVRHAHLVTCYSVHVCMGCRESAGFLSRPECIILHAIIIASWSNFTFNIWHLNV